MEKNSWILIITRVATFPKQIYVQEYFWNHAIVNKSKNQNDSEHVFQCYTSLGVSGNGVLDVPLSQVPDFAGIVLAAGNWKKTYK